MLAPTHSVFGIFLTLVILAVFGVSLSLHWTVIAFAVIGAILPDIDQPRSLIGRVFAFISVPVERKLGHRTFTHSLLAWAAFTLGFGVLLIIISLIIDYSHINRLAASFKLLKLRWLAAFSIGYFSHLFLDMFNKRGSQLFWPHPARDVIPANPRFRTESGAKIELVIFLFLLILMILALPLSKYGIGSSLRWLLATPGSAIEEYKMAKTRTYLEFEGVIGESKKPISGTAEILNVENKRLVIKFEDSIYTLSDEVAADIVASKVHVKYGDTAVIISDNVFTNETRENLLKLIPKGSLLTGKVKLPIEMQIEFPLKSSDVTYKTMEQKEGYLILNYASKEEIEALSLDKSYELSIKKDKVALNALRRKKQENYRKINALQNYDDGLTAKGRQYFNKDDEAQKRQQQIETLKGNNEEIDMQIEELKYKLDSRRFLFSGEVKIRR